MFDQTPKGIVQTKRLPFLIGLAVFLLVMGVFMYKAQTNQRKEGVETRPRQSIDISPKATTQNSWFNEEKFRHIRINYAAALRGPTAREAERRMISGRELDLKKQELQDEYATRLEIKKIEDKEQIDAKKLELQAMRSPLSIDVPPLPGTSPSASGKQPRKDALTDSLDQIIDSVRSATASKIPSLAAALNNPDGKQAFLSKNASDDDYLETTKKKPRSPYELKAGSYISAALITGINSDLPGNVNAQVTENVYDSVTGNYLLIPQGSKLVGEYNSQLTFGQNRVQVVWNRIIFPDGQSIDLEKMQGADIGGYTGFFDKVDNHYFRIYGSAILLSLVGAGYDILNRQQEESTDARSAVAANVGQKLSDVSGQTLEKNLNVQPTLIIDPGYKFKVMVMKDMVLENIDDAEGTLSYSK